jgi:putative ABC transport system substrate-binding protein
MAGLKRYGYEEGRNLELVHRTFPLSRPELGGPAVAEMIELKPDVIISPFTPGTLALQKATRTIPIVFVSVADPISTLLVETAARPGGNITGIANSGSDIFRKQVELLRELVPNSSDIAFIWNTKSPPAARMLDQLKASKLSQEIKTVLLPIENATELSSLFDRPTAVGLRAAVVVVDPLVFAHRDTLASAALQRGIALMSPSKEEAEAGSLIAYGPDLQSLYQRAAYFVDRIAKGTPPARLPVEFPTKFNLVVNSKTALALGITIPDAILAQADAILD